MRSFYFKLKLIKIDDSFTFNVKIFDFERRLDYVFQSDLWELLNKKMTIEHE
jgi:hypothetical protein